MTYILGAKCSDGVVLVGDQKIVCDNEATYDKKLETVLSSVVLAGAGIDGLINILTNEIHKQIKSEKIKNHMDLLKVAEEKGYELSQTYESRVGAFEMLLGVKTKDDSRLYNLIPNQGFAEPVRKYVTIGSGGSYASILLRTLWSDNMNMLEFASLGHFLINFIVEMGLDENIGGDIDVCFIPNANGMINKSGKNPFLNIHEARPDEIKIIKKYTNDMIIYTKQFISKLKKKHESHHKNYKDFNTRLKNISKENIIGSEKISEELF